MAGWRIRIRNGKAAILRCFPVLAAAMAALVAIAAFPVSAAPEGSRFNEKYFTNVPVITHKGETVPFYDALIKGKMVVINFIYLSCNDICPLTTSRVAEIRRKLGDMVGRDIFIYSITMDPENDTPELLNDYAEAFDAGEGWVFLTGSPDEIKKLRWRLGERSRNLYEHRNDLVFGNEITGEWSRSSVYSDIDLTVRKVRELDPDWLAKKQTVSSKTMDVGAYRLDKTPGQALFIKACSTCHSIGGGDFVGPDLKHITRRRDPIWLRRFMMEPDKMRAEKDPLTMALSAQYKGVMMPDLALNENDVTDLLAYIETRSQAPQTNSAAVDDRPDANETSAQ
jgi:protein SCO1/2